MPDAAAQPGPAVRPVLVQLTVGNRPLQFRVEVPTGPIRPEALLPLYRALADRLTAMAARAAADAGDAVSCRKGCSACCRQLVAISALEARELMKLVERLPEPRRSVVRQRFADARRRLEAEAPQLIEPMLHPHEHPMSNEQSMEMARAYLRLGIDCPFLEDNACSIYDQRPVACRQYMVVSAPEHCATLSPEVRSLEPSGGPASQWMPVWERARTGHAADYVGMVLAPDFVAEHPQEPPARPGTEIFNEFLTRMQQRGKWEKKPQP